MLQVSTDRPRRHLDAILALDELRYRLAGPQVEWQRQPIRHRFDDQLADSHGLPVIQPATFQSTATLAWPERSQAAFSRPLHPVAYCPRTCPECVSRRGLRDSINHRLHHYFSQVRLRGPPSRCRASVFVFIPVNALRTI